MSHNPEKSKVLCAVAAILLLGDGAPAIITAILVLFVVITLNLGLPKLAILTIVVTVLVFYVILAGGFALIRWAERYRGKC